ncbi:hypothetical protein F4604DRAFT_1524719, partial [Suillus subluteus]
RNTADFALVARQKTDFTRTRIVDSVLMDWTMLQFSTTTDAERYVYDMSMMAMRNSISTDQRNITCGPPGEKGDWKMMLEQLVRLFRYDIEGITWKHFLPPVISRFVENLDLWSEAAPHGGGGREPTYLSGRITVFCVF